MSVLSALRPAAMVLCMALPSTLPMPLRAETSPPLAETAQALAETAQARIAALSEILQIAPMLEVLKQEGLHAAADLDADMLDGQGGAVWLAKVGAVYDVGRMRQIFDRAMLGNLGSDPEALAGIEAFFATDLGHRVMALELEARRMLLDDTAEAAAKQAFVGVKSAGGARLRGLADFTEVNDLIESNVMGALNANLAFYRGLGREGVFDGGMTEDQMLAEVWSAEAAMRAETEDWLYPFLNLAYQPLTEAELRAYVEFSRTDAGQRLNRAMFGAFDQIFAVISYDLGRALGRQMQGEDL